MFQRYGRTRAALTAVVSTYHAAGAVRDVAKALGLPPVEDDITHPSRHPVLRVAVWAVAFLLVAVVAFLATRLFNGTHHSTGWELVTETLKSDIFWKAVAVGLLAQTVDGALGMAYGITSSSFLMATGSTPAVASADFDINKTAQGLSGEKIHLELLLADRASFIMREAKFSENQTMQLREDGRFYVSAEVNDTPKLRAALWEMADTVEVLAPAKLREHFAALSQKMYAKYLSAV